MVRWISVIVVIDLALGCGRFGFDSMVCGGGECLVADDGGSTLGLNVEVVVGSISADLETSMGQRGVVYSALYGSRQAEITAAEVRDEGTGVTSQALFAGVVTLEAADVPLMKRIEQLEPETPYWLYVIGEGETAGLQGDEDVQELSWSTHPRHQARQVMSSIGTEMINYWIFYPEAYYRLPEQSYPVILFLHGHGDRTSSGRTFEQYRDSEYTLTGRLERREGRLADPDFPFIVISPQCVENIGNCWGWRDDAHTVVADALADADQDARQSLDSARVYVTGVSTGGEGTYQFVSRHANLVAAAAPLMSTGPATTTPSRCNMESVAIWALHSVNDTLQDPTNDSGMVGFLNANCSMQTAAVYSGGDWIGGGNNHVGDKEVYNDDHAEANGAFTSIYDWFLAHSKD